MSKFDRYMLSQLMMFFGFFALVLVSIYWVNSAVRLFDRLISDGQSVWVFLEMTALTLPNVIRLMLPIAAFVAAVYATSRMASESELVVMQSTGFSPLRMARPVITFGLIVALMISALAHFLVPAARTRLNERNAEITANVSSKLLNEGRFLHPADGLTLYIRAILATGELTDIYLVDARTPTNVATYTAKRAFLVKTNSGPKLVMFDGMAQALKKPQAELSVTRFADFTYDIGALMAARGPRYPSLNERPTSALLWPSEELLRQTGASRAAAIFEGHDRMAKPLLAMAAALIGFAAMLTGGFTRFGLWRQISLASALLVLLFFGSNLTDKIAARDESLVALAYAPAAFGTALALAMLVWTMRRRRPPRLLGAAPKAVAA
ncbi:MAG: LPS export ABC transporter permease LptF [Albidovulum sp.]